MWDRLADVVVWRESVSSPEKVEYFFMRTARMAAWGFMIGPVISVWYRTLHIGTEAMQVSYAPVVRGRIAGLLERITTSFAHQGLSVTEATIKTLPGGIARDTFDVIDAKTGNSVVTRDGCAGIEERLRLLVESVRAAAPSEG